MTQMVAEKSLTVAGLAAAYVAARVRHAQLYTKESVEALSAARRALHEAQCAAVRRPAPLACCRGCGDAVPLRATRAGWLCDDCFRAARRA